MTNRQLTNRIAALRAAKKNATRRNRAALCRSIIHLLQEKIRRRNKAAFYKQITDFFKKG